MESQCSHFKNSMQKMIQLFSPLPSYHINVKPSDSYIRVKGIFSLLQQIIAHGIKEGGHWHSQRLGN